MESIIRGTNALVQIKIKEDVNFAQLSGVELSIWQSGKQILKQQADLVFDTENNTISYELTQEESLSLVANRAAEITLWGMLGGKRFETRPVLTVNVENTRKNEVIA